MDIILIIMFISLFVGGAGELSLDGFAKMIWTLIFLIGLVVGMLIMLIILILGIL